MVCLSHTDLIRVLPVLSGRMTSEPAVAILIPSISHQLHASPNKTNYPKIA